MRAANVGGSHVFSTAALARKLDLVNIGAAGTFVSSRPITAHAIARELPFDAGIAIRPAAEVTRLVDAGRPKTPPGTHVFVSVLVGRPTRRPSLPLELPTGPEWALRVVERHGAFVVSVRRIEAQRGLDLSAVLEREFGVPFTTRSWGTMLRVAAAVRAL